MDWFTDHWPETWLIAAVALAALEIMSGDLILIMLAGGAVAALVVALVGGAFIWQSIVGVVASIALLAMIRPALVHRLHKGPTLTTGAQAVVGSRALVLEDVAHAAPGRIKIGGDVWSAQPYDEDDRIEAGTSVDVVSIKGGIAYVLRTQPSGPEDTDTKEI